MLPWKGCEPTSTVRNKIQGRLRGDFIFDPRREVTAPFTPIYWQKYE